MDYCPRVNANGRLSMFGADIASHFEQLSAMVIESVLHTWVRCSIRRADYQQHQKCLQRRAIHGTFHCSSWELLSSFNLSLFSFRSLFCLSFLYVRLQKSWKEKNEWKMLSQYCIEEKFLINAEKRSRSRIFFQLTRLCHRQQRFYFRLDWLKWLWVKRLGRFKMKLE